MNQKLNWVIFFSVCIFTQNVLAVLRGNFMYWVGTKCIKEKIILHWFREGNEVACQVEGKVATLLKKWTIKAKVELIKVKLHILTLLYFNMFLFVCVVVTPVEYFPYFDQKYLAVAASLNGGNALAAFVCMLQHWTHELGFNVTQCECCLFCYSESVLIR